MRQITDWTRKGALADLLLVLRQQKDDGQAGLNVYDHLHQIVPNLYIDSVSRYIENTHAKKAAYRPHPTDLVFLLNILAAAPTHLQASECC